MCELCGKIYWVSDNRWEILRLNEFIKKYFPIFSASPKCWVLIDESMQDFLKKEWFSKITIYEEYWEDFIKLIK